MADPAQLNAEIEKYERRYAEHPEGRDFVPLANAYRKLGELGRAEHLLRTGLQQHPEYLSAHIVLGRVLADRGAADEAASEFRHVLSVDPQNLIALRTLGELASGEGRDDEAGYWYRELLAVDPMNDEARAALEQLDRSGVEADADFQSGGGWWESPPEPQPAAGEEPSEALEPLADLEPLEALEELQPLAPLEEPTTPVVPTGAGPIGGSPGSDRPEPSETAEPSEGRRYAGEQAEAADDDPSEFEVDVELEPLPEPVATSDVEVLAPVRPEATAEPADTQELEPLEADAANLDTPGDLASETLAELYADQGFVDEAVAMYRELIRRRGEQPELLRRLGELEEQAEQLAPSRAGPDGPPAWIDASDPAGAGEIDAAADETAGVEEPPGVEPGAGTHAGREPEPDPVPWSDPAPEASPGDALTEAAPPPPHGDPFAGSFDAGFPTDDYGSAAPTSPELPPEEPPQEESAVEEPAVEEPAVEEPAVEEPRAEEPRAEEPRAEEPTAEAPTEERAADVPTDEPLDEPAAEPALEAAQSGGRRIATAFGTLLAWRPPSIDAPAAAPPPAPAVEAAPERDADEPGAADDDEPFPWELPPPADLGAADAGSEADRDVVESRAEGDEPRGEEAEAGLAAPPPDEQPVSSPGARPAAAWDAAPADDDDDDLESFQAWLRSLKR